MSDTPHRSPDDGEPQEPDFRQMLESLLRDADNPAMQQALQSMGIDRLDPAMTNMIASQLQSFFQAAPTDGMNLELAADTARKTVAAHGHQLVTDARRRSVEDSVRVADMWLDQVTGLSVSDLRARAWSRAEWVDATMDTWGRLVGPVAQGVNDAIVGAMRGQFERLGEDGPIELPGMPGLPQGFDISSMLGQFEPMLTRMSSSVFGAQIGQAVGSLAREVVSGTEVGLPLVDTGVVAILPSNVEAFTEGLEIDDAQVELYLALREAARVRLFGAVPWLGPQLVAAVQAYARDIEIDTDGIEAKLANVDATNPEALQEALSDGLFSPTPSEGQKAALARLETLLALVEGWVDVVAERAAAPHLPQAAALGETVRRRRATGGPAEQLFGQLVGLELRPRRLRDAANLFSALEDKAGAEARDEAWAHPDVAPTAADLDDVLGYVERRSGGGAEGEADASGDDLDAELARILDAGLDGTDAGTAGEDGAAGEDGEDGEHDDSDGPSDGEPPARA